MNRDYLVVMLIVAFAASLVVYSLKLAQNKTIPASSAPMITVSSDATKLIDATSRLIYHSKKVAIESITITKHSVNLAFDVVIEALE